MALHLVLAVGCLAMASVLLLRRKWIIALHARRGRDTSTNPWTLLGWTMLLLGTTQLFAATR
jgi:hypothetical protein